MFNALVGCTAVSQTARHSTRLSALLMISSAPGSNNEALGSCQELPKKRDKDFLLFLFRVLRLDSTYVCTERNETKATVQHNVFPGVDPGKRPDTRKYVTLVGRR